MSGCLRIFAVSAAVVLAVGAPPLAAAAPTLAAPVPGTVLLGFGEPYGDSRVHSGLDIAAPAGVRVLAPAAGTVTFAGRLPSAEGDALGVTITTPDGFKVTCLPLADLRVGKGGTVRAGEDLGPLAGEGDGSSERAHVHLSVREGESYLDPARLLPASPAPSEPERSPQTPPVASGPAAAPVDVVADAPAIAGVPAPAAAPAGKSVGGDVLAGEIAPLSVSAAPVEAPLRASAAVEAIAECASALRGPGSMPRMHPFAPTAGSPAIDAAIAAFSRLRVLVTALAALLVAAACLWPVWRRASVSAPAGEVVPVRVRP